MSLLPSPRQSFLYFVLCGLGLIIAVAGITLLVAGVTTASWPTTSGKLLSSAVYRSTSQKAQRTFSPDLTYEYTVDGRSYIGGFTRVGGLSFTYEPNAEQYIKDKQSKASIPVYYIPFYPSVAVIERGASTSPWIIAGGGIALFLVFRILSLVNQKQNG